MTVRELFSCCDTDSRRIIIYDKDNEVIYTKHSNKPIGKLNYFESVIAWIYTINAEEIALRVE